MALAGGPRAIAKSAVSAGPAVSERLTATGAEAWEQAQDLCYQDLYHEVLEERREEWQRSGGPPARTARAHRCREPLRCRDRGRRGRPSRFSPPCPGYPRSGSPGRPRAHRGDHLASEPVCLGEGFGEGVDRKPTSASSRRQTPPPLRSRRRCSPVPPPPRPQRGRGACPRRRRCGRRPPADESGGAGAALSSAQRTPPERDSATATYSGGWRSVSLVIGRVRGGKIPYVCAISKH